MTTFRVRSRNGSYLVRVAPGILARLGAFARSVGISRRAIVVSDAHVAALHARAALRALRAAGLSAELLTVPPGERAKSPRQVRALWTAFAALELDRDSAVVALGGGVVGDLAGFAAATYLRGLPLLHVPTSLLAQVDSSIGGKVGVNLRAAKNLVGSFYAPRGVLTDPELLGTLPRRQLRAGLAEVVKAGMALDVALFRQLERAAEALLEPGAPGLAPLVQRAALVKGRLVARDELEAGPRSALNFGHTLAHALEAAHEYRILHGEAVSVGMLAAASLSRRVAGLPERDRLRLESLLRRLRLPLVMPPTPLGKLQEAMVLDKKNRAGKIRWVLTPRVGFASLPRPVDGRLVRAVLLEVGAGADGSIPG